MPTKSAYTWADQRSASNSAAKKRSVEGRDIFDDAWKAGIKARNMRRRRRCERDFRRFCETYFGRQFAIDWSDDHLRVIGQIEASVLSGGLFATAMPRGSGKTTLCETACTWALLYGHRSFVCLIGSDEGRASEMIESIKTELETNELLEQDFYETLSPIVRLEGIAHRCNGQIHKGERTHIGWTAKELVLPMIPGSPGAGGLIRGSGLTGGIRGMKYKRPDGRSVRPDLVVIDDPQTDESARSESQCETRRRILAGAVLGLAGPGRKISGLMPCTVIRRGDMADVILDRDKHPEWQGTRTKMVYAFPTAEKLWARYAELRADGLRAEDGGKAATEFYREHRAEMDAGARVAWPARHNPDELSAIQHAMNLRLADERAFFAEYQNEPLPEEESRGDDLTADQVAGKINRMPRRQVPIGCTRLTAFVDVQATLLYYLVVGWEEGFTGYVVDYGTEPEQDNPYFTLRDARTKLKAGPKGAGLEGILYAGLESLTDRLLSREWLRDDGATMRIDRLMVDANWGASTETIYQFARQSAHAGRITPSHGKFIGASSVPMREYQKRPGDRVGLNWRMPNVAGRRQVRYAVYDTNFWKSFVHQRLAVPMGDRGCLSLFGDKPERHKLLADHLTAEYRVRTEGRGRTVDEWKLRPERPDNHWLDCLAGAAVAASIEGVVLPEASPEARRPVERVSFAELQRRKRGA